MFCPNESLKNPMVSCTWLFRGLNWMNLNYSGSFALQLILQNRTNISITEPNNAVLALEWMSHNVHFRFVLWLKKWFINFGRSDPLTFQNKAETRSYATKRNLIWLKHWPDLTQKWVMERQVNHHCPIKFNSIYCTFVWHRPRLPSFYLFIFLRRHMKQKKKLIVHSFWVSIYLFF